MLLKKLSLAILFITLLNLSADNSAADPTRVSGPSAVGVFGEASSAARPNPTTGAMTYSIPFELPLARGAAQPKLALTYSSAASDREAGYGWGMDLAFIERKPLSGWPKYIDDGNPRREDRYVFNGQPLVFICVVADRGCEQPSAPMPAWAKGWRYYRFQIEGEFARFFLNPSRTTWRVQRKGGEILELGSPFTQPTLGPTAMEMGESNKVYRWRLVRQVDVDGNLVVYFWRPLGVRGLLYPIEIYYTPPAAGPVTLNAFAYHVQLSWENPGFSITRYARIDKAEADMRLTRVAVASMPWSGVAPRQVIRVYHLRYFANRAPVSYVYENDAPLWHHSFLKEIQLEGKCSNVESGGQIPVRTDCGQFPPMSFQYQSGALVRKGGGHSETHDTPPDEDEVHFKVFPWVESVAIVDLNRDGLPDLVQSWPANEIVRFPDSGCSGCETEDTTAFFRKKPAYLNIGDKNQLQVQLRHQCMDMGTGNPGSISFYNLGKPAGFLTGSNGASLLGSWGDSLLLWSLADYSQITAVPKPADPSFCDMFSADPSHGAWVWQRGDEIGWSKHVGNGQPSPFSRNRWFSDVDGDGLPDSFDRTAGGGGDLERARVDFSKRLSKAENGNGAAMVPFNLDLSTSDNSLTPAERPRSATRFFYVDVDGDGLVDLVTYNPSDEGGAPLVRAGDGRGFFGCDGSRQPTPCAPPPSGSPSWLTMTSAIDVPDPIKPWPFNDETFLHDVTGDGLADIIKYEAGHGATTPGIIRLWINQDGHTFRCATPGNTNPCQVNSFVDDLHGTGTIEPHRITFADMDANGVDDIVLIGKSGVWASSAYTSLPFTSPRAPRPGLLVKIDNGIGATTLIDYRTIQELDLEATGNKKPWEFHSPQVVPVVVQIRTVDPKTATGIGTTAEPYRIDRKTSYEYRDPAYDSWSRSFLGFRKVRVKEGFDQGVTETTYWFGPCLRGLKVCPQSSDDDEFKANSGLPVRVDRFVPAVFGQDATKLLSTTLYQYTREALFQTSDRTVWHAFAHTVETFLYDPEKPFQQGGTFNSVGGGDPLTGPAAQIGRQHIVESFDLDQNGNLVKTVSEGRPREDGGSGPGVDGRITREAQVHCNSAWQCLTDNVIISSDPVEGENRQTRYTYDLLGRLKLAEAFLVGVLPLQRSHEVVGSAIAPLPSTASTPGWKKMLSFDYDAFGNVVKIEGAGASPTCTTLMYEPAYGQFPQATETHLAGCTTAAIVTTREFDRGFGTLISERSPTGSLTDILLDEFGRIERINSPQPDGPLFSTVQTVTYRYHDQSPLSSVFISRRTGTGPDLQSFEVTNGLGEGVFGFDLADPTAGDLGGWVLRDWTERDSTGRVKRLYRPSFFSGNPLAIAQATTPLPTPTAAGSVDFSYDAFSRLMFVTDGSVLAAKYIYKPLATETYDAEQLKPGSLRLGQHTTTLLDGHGRPTTRIDVVRGDDIRLDVRFLPTGEPTKITQSHKATQETVIRNLFYDSLGRLVGNVEPNTSLANGKSWRYAWDDEGRLVGISDARGCGENFFYDGLGRRLAEDYSPCLKTQAAYTQPNLTTGEGTEAFYQYDKYEPGQLNTGVGFVDNPRLAIGRLVSLRDRGAHTRINYDNRGRARLITRRIAVPGTSAAALEDRYSKHWFETRRTYDVADRLTTETTGVDVPELLAGGASVISYSYSARGSLRQIASSYGILLKETRFDADGAPREMVYGDAATTKARFGYDQRRRLTQYNVARSAPALWGIATPTYTLPSADTKQLELQTLTFSYDDVGNILKVTDASPPASWPAGIQPTTRSISYDDLDRVTRVDYANSTDRQVSPYAAEEESSDRRSIPVRGGPRMAFQTFAYDWKGNMTASDDDRRLRYDRSLGAIINGENTGKPNQFRGAGPGMKAEYDAAGNLIDLTVERKGCRGMPALPCTHRFVYEWDEIGQLSRARRWDYPGGTIPTTEPHFPDIPTTVPVWDLHYAYSNRQRVLTTFKNRLGDERHTLDVFGTLRLTQTKFRGPDYDRKPEIITAYLAGMGRLLFDPGLPSPSGDAKHIFLFVGDHLGSTSAVIDYKTGELVERTAYQAYGSLESDYRPKRWNSFREAFKFTGKEDEMEVGAIYFGARYYNPHLGRFLSADPLTIHALGADLNPYSYASGRVTNGVDPFGLDMVEVGCTGGESQCFEIVDESPSPTASKEIESQGRDESSRSQMIRQPESMERVYVVPPSRQSFEDSTPIFPFFLPMPSEYHRPYQPAPEGAPNGLDSIRRLNGQPGLGVAAFSRDQYPGTDVRNLTVLTVSVISSVAADATQVGTAAAQATRAGSLVSAGNTSARSAVGNSTARTPAQILTETFGKGRAAPGSGPTSVREAETVLRELENGTFKPPSDLTREHLDYYERVAKAAIDNPQKRDPLGVQTLRLQIIEKLRSIVK